MMSLLLARRLACVRSCDSWDELPQPQQNKRKQAQTSILLRFNSGIQT
jgi:hypothetical protein